MKNSLFPFIVLLLLACNNSQKKNSSGVKNDSSSTTQQSENSTKSPPVFKIIVVDKNDQTLKDSIQGTKVDELRWQDTEGVHRVLFTMIPVHINKSGYQAAAIFAYCYTKKGLSWKKKWEVKDKIEACQVDATCEFLPNSFNITDNDRNNLGEVTFLYKLSCKGDVSPDEKKLIMYEDGNKYAIRGTTIINYAGEKKGGEKNVDESFSKVAKPLLDFANTQWDKFGTTNY